MNDNIARENMLKQQLRTWHVLEPAVLNVLATTPREQFVPKGYENLAFADMSIPVTDGRAMMTPGEEGRLLQELAIQPTDKALLLGIDSGYLMTCLSKIAQHVYAVETNASLRANAEQKIQDFHLANVSMLDADVHSGWELEVPFDVIILTGSVFTVPQPILEALAVGGRLYAVIGQDPAMSATIFQRVSDGQWDQTSLYETRRPRLANVSEPSHFSF